MRSLNTENKGDKPSSGPVKQESNVSSYIYWAETSEVEDPLERPDP